MKFGKEAIIAANFPHEFVAVAMLKSHELNISLAIRSGQPPNTCKGFPVSPKPMAIKTKTCSYEQHVRFLAGFIAWNQFIFGQKKSCPIPENGFKPVQLYVSLREIIADARNGEYDGFTLKNNCLEFKAPFSDTDTKKNITFSLDLSKRRKSLELDNKTVKMLTPWVKNPTIEKPKCWNDSLGNFDELINDLYPISYCLQGGYFLPVQVAATLDGKPITGDADILWIGIPVKLADASDHKQYNVTNSLELKALLFNFLFLCKRIKVDELASLLDHIESFAKTAGVITPYELLTEKLINDEFAKSCSHFFNLLQHGPETNNPGKPSSLDGKILHFYHGLPVLTENEDELIQLVTQKGFLEKYYIRIHPGWNMEKWSPVIKRQIELNQHVNPDTLVSYRAYHALQQAHKDKITENNQNENKHQLRRLISCQMAFLKGPNKHVMSNTFSNEFNSKLICNM